MYLGVVDAWGKKLVRTLSIPRPFGLDIVAPHGLRLLDIRYSLKSYRRVHAVPKLAVTHMTKVLTCVKYYCEP